MKARCGTPVQWRTAGRSADRHGCTAGGRHHLLWPGQLRAALCLEEHLRGVPEAGGADHNTVYVGVRAECHGEYCKQARARALFPLKPPSLVRKGLLCSYAGCLAAASFGDA